MNGTQLISNDSYNYTDQESDNSWKYGNILGYSLLFIAGLLNVPVVCLIPGVKKLRTVNNILIFNICLAGLVLILSLPPVLLTKYLGYWYFSEQYCRMNMFMEATAKQATIYFITMAALERYFAVCRPQVYRKIWTSRVAIGVCLAGWIICGLFMLPVLIFSVLVYDITQVDPDDQMKSLQCFLWFHHTQDRIIFLTVTIVALFLIPTVMILVSYVLILSRMKKSAKRTGRLRSAGSQSTLRKESTDTMGDVSLRKPSCQPSLIARRLILFTRQSSHGSNRSLVVPPLMQVRTTRRSETMNKSVTRTVLILIGIFLISWSPYWILSFLTVFGLVPSRDNPFLGLLFNAIHMLPYLGTALNPVFYLFTTDRFKDSQFCVRSRKSYTTNTSLGTPTMFRKQSTLSNLTLTSLRNPKSVASRSFVTETSINGRQQVSYHAVDSDEQKELMSKEVSV